MKKKWLFFMAAAAALSLAACAPAVPTAAAGNPTGTVQPAAGDEESSSSAAEPEENSQRVAVSDAAQYRGIVLSVEESGGGTVVTLEQAAGTDFGAKSLRFIFTSETALSFGMEELAAGDYLEVYYGRGEGQPLAEGEQYKAIAANRYPSADLVLCNGELKQHTKDSEEEGKGTLVLKRLDNEQEIVFHYTESTQFYLNVDELKTGDQLNIFYSGMLTRSLPPQGTALEVRPYAQTSVDCPVEPEQ